MGLIFDAVLVIIALAAVLVGVKKGFAKIFSKGVCRFIAFFASVAACYLIMQMFILPNGWLDTWVNQVIGLVTGLLANINMENLGATIGGYLSVGIVYFFIWLVFYLIVKYLMYGIKYLMEKIAQVPVFSTIDRIFGVCVSLVVAFIVTFIIAIIAMALLGDMIMSYMSSSYLFKYLAQIINDSILPMLGSYLPAA